jgi:glucosamine-6-phosphate deaminase
MKIIEVDNYQALSTLAADLAIKQINHKPASVLGLPTGSTPLGLYQKLVTANRRSRVSFRKVKTFNLDEYYGLAAQNRQSYRYFMNKNLFANIDIDLANTHVPLGLFNKSEEKIICRGYEAAITKSRGIDLQILGLGANGHIGFNEPGSSFSSKTRLVKLSRNTIRANARFFDHYDQVPREAVTMGLGTILKAKKIIVLVSGENKAKAFGRLSRGRLDINFPALILLKHKDVTVIVDKSAIR